MSLFAATFTWDTSRFRVPHPFSGSVQTFLFCKFQHFKIIIVFLRHNTVRPFRLFVVVRFPYHGILFLLHQLFKLHTIQNTTPQGSTDETFKLSHIFTEQFRRLVIQGIIRVGFVEQINESINDRINIQDRFPVFSQDIKTNFAL